MEANTDDLTGTLNRRPTSMDNVAPTTAAKVAAMQAEMRELFADYNRHMSMLFGSIQARLEILATQAADIAQRLPPRA
jgi:hypothetical protein